jgi:hypothetical protein
MAITNAKVWDYSSVPQPPAPTDSPQDASALGAYLGGSKKKPRASTPISLAPLTQAEWDGLSGKAKWDSQVALRGPDLVGSQDVKIFTTSIIRYRLSQVMRVGGLVNDWLPFTIVPQGTSGLVSARARFQFDWSHFIGHVIEACNWLSIPMIQIATEDWKKVLLSDEKGSITYIGKVCQMVQYVPEGDYRETMIQVCQRQFGLTSENITKYGEQKLSKEEAAYQTIQALKGSVKPAPIPVSDEGDF